MNTQGAWMVVVTYQEWLNWMARGEIRLNTRIAKVAGPGDNAAFAQLMSRAPDLRIDDEQGFVLACLDPSFRSMLADVPGSLVPEVATLSLKAVAEFMPVTERAGRLLEGDARRAHARLGAPIFESAWRRWTIEKQAADADRRGRTLSVALGVPQVDPSQIPTIVLGYLRGDQRLPNADRLAEYEGGRAYGWAAAFGLLALLSNEEAKKDFTKRFELGPLILYRKNDYALGRAILEDEAAGATARRIGVELRDKFGVDIDMEQLAAFWHYEQQLRRGKDIELDALVRDVATLYVRCSPTAAANTAWLIGRLMEEAAVTALLYTATASDWPTMVGTGLHRDSFDVVRAAQRMRQEMANNGAADISSSREVIGSNPVDLDAKELRSASSSSVGSEIEGMLTKPTAPVKEAIASTAAPLSAPLNDPQGAEFMPTTSVVAPVDTTPNCETDSVPEAMPHDLVQESTAAVSAVQPAERDLFDKTSAPPLDGTTTKTTRKTRPRKTKGAAP